jgi:hypothetical protein
VSADLDELHARVERLEQSRSFGYRDRVAQRRRAVVELRASGLSIAAPWSAARDRRVDGRARLAADAARAAREGCRHGSEVAPDGQERRPSITGTIF